MAESANAAVDGRVLRCCESHSSSVHGSEVRGGRGGGVLIWNLIDGSLQYPVTRLHSFCKPRDL